MFGGDVILYYIACIFKITEKNISVLFENLQLQFNCELSHSRKTIRERKLIVVRNENIYAELFKEM